MKKVKTPSKNQKITSFFTKKETEKIPEKSCETSPILSQITNVIDNRKRKSDEKSVINESKKVCSNNNFKVVSPNQQIRPSTSNGTLKTTPNKKTPKKLFDKSPKQLNEFNVEVINKFVRITPSKSSEKTSFKANVLLSPTRNECSSQKAQNINEVTPKKMETPKSRLRLNFSESKATNWENETDFNLSDIDDLIQLAEGLTLDLSGSKHCTILGVTKELHKIVLRLQSGEERAQAICNVEGFWSTTALNVGDSVYVTAQKLSNNEWLINNEKGFLVYEPNLLISCTSVVSSLMCKRRSVLSHRFKEAKSTNRYMLIGKLVHTLLQTTLKLKLDKESEILIQLRQLLSSKSLIKSLYEEELTVGEIEGELMIYIPRIVEFIENYVKTNRRSLEKGNWDGKIVNIEDIEENIWCPELGIKGHIDVTIKTQFETMPLEVKSGKASVSFDHQGQVILYIMMMRKLGYNVNSGLLLYLKEGVLRQIPISSQNQRDIMILRNELAYYLMQKASKSPVLPPAINRPQICNKCPLKAPCMAFLRHDLQISSDLQQYRDKSLNHLSESHLNYFMHWNNLIAMESTSQFKYNKKIQDIYTQSPKVREKNGRCITDLNVEKCEEINGLHEHYFSSVNRKNFLIAGISENDYIIVSTDTRPAIASGFVTAITSVEIQVTLDRRITEKFPKQLFHLDTYDSAVMEAYNLIGLSLLLETTPKAAKLRAIIIDKTPPTFMPKLSKSIAKKGAPILARLNRNQQRAVLKALSANDFLLIKGMPGTGKTTTIVTLIQLLIELGKSVLITSHTHSAVDNICVKLLKFNIDFIRLGQENRICEELKEKSEGFLTRNCKTVEEFKEVLDKPQVIAVTCLGSGHPLLSKRVMDVCIVDESTQILQTTTIRPLYASKMFVLIGDPDQLPPVVKNADALKEGMSESLFERLISSDAIVPLNINYRMNEKITALANAFTYKGELLIGNDQIAKSTLELAKKPAFKQDKWVEQLLNTDLDASVQILDTGAVWKRSQVTPKWFLQTNLNRSENYINIYEAALINVLVNNLVACGVCCSNIGVIATFKNQVEQISVLLNGKNIDVSTVDQFQGKEKSIIIYSCSFSRNLAQMSDQKNMMLEDRKRITVAITRAKHKLIIIGDLSTIQNYATIQDLLKFVGDKFIVRLDEDFDWDKILNYAHNK